LTAKMPLRHSLQTRMIITILFLLAVLMIVTTYAGIRRESQGILDQMNTDGIALARAYALSAENALLLKKAGLGRVTGEASRTSGIRYLKIVDKEMRIISHTDPYQIGFVETDEHLRKALGTPITAVDRGKTPYTDIKKDNRNGDVFRIIIPLVLLDQVTGALEIGLDTTSIAEAIARTNTQSLIIALIAFITSGAYIWFFARSLTRPIKKLVQAAEGIAAGDLDHDIAVTSKDEIGHLATVFSYMTRELKEYMGDLKRTNAQLEADAATIEKLRRYNENILASISPGVLTVDLAGKITTLNQAGLEILQLKNDEALGKRFEEIFAQDNCLRVVLSEALTDRKNCYDFEGSLTGANHHETLLLLNTAMLTDQLSKAVGVVVTFEDITEVRLLQKRISEAEKLAAMGELALGIAHEVRNPLGAMKTCAQFLEAKFSPEDMKYKMSQLIIREIDRLNQLVERLLDFTRQTANDFQYENVNEIVERVLALAELKMNNEGYVVERDYDPNAPRLFVDAKRLQQAFLNVMLNAIDAMPKEGKLVVSTRVEADHNWLRIDISDTGEGIQSDKLDKVYNPFFTTKQQGTGLGLAIVHQIVTEHNGVTSVHSIHGQGTTLTIKLPISGELSPSKANEA